MLQIVGESCFACGERLRSEAGAGGCVACATAFHQKCAPRGECPSCGANHHESWRAARRSHDRSTDGAALQRVERERQRGLGRWLFLCSVGLAALLVVVASTMDVGALAVSVGLVLVTGLGVTGLALFLMNLDQG